MLKTTSALPESLKQAWTDYVSAEKDRLRQISLEKLSVFIRHAQAEDLSQLKRWVFYLMIEVVDGESDFPLRLPLLDEVLFPILFEEYQNRESGCARWLAGLSSLLYHSKAARSAFEKLPSRISFLQRAVEDDPKDLLSKQAWVQEMASLFEDALHELPAGVLWGMNGATSEKCEILECELAEFQPTIETLNCLEKHEELIESCKIHFSAYPQYLSQVNQYDFYEVFLLEKQLPLN